MINIGSKVLEHKNFPIEKENNIKTLHKKVKNGSLGISLSSFDEIYTLTPKGTPFPIGSINFEDCKKRFVISWIEDFSKLKINEIEGYSLKIRNYPTEKYPVLSLLIGINTGKIDPETKKDLWYYGESHLDISFMITRIKLYQLLNSDEVLFCLFDKDVENLDSYGFPLKRDEMNLLLEEIESIFKITSDMDLSGHIKDFSIASKVVEDSFNKNGLPKTREALNIYLKRKNLNPKPSRYNWADFISI